MAESWIPREQQLHGQDEAWEQQSGWPSTYTLRLHLSETLPLRRLCVLRTLRQRFTIASQK